MRQSVFPGDLLVALNDYLGDRGLSRSLAGVVRIVRNDTLFVISSAPVEKTSLAFNMWNVERYRVTAIWRDTLIDTIVKTDGSTFSVFRATT